MSIDNIKLETSNLQKYIGKAIYIVNTAYIDILNEWEISKRIIEGFIVSKDTIHIITNYGNYDIQEYNIFFEQVKAEEYAKEYESKLKINQKL